MTSSTMRPLERARAISGLIADEALESERLGRLTDRVAQALLDAGLYSSLLPAADGGLGGDRVEFFETVEEVARADGSAGWCLSVCNAINEFFNRAGTAEARKEVLGAGPVAMWGSLLPRANSVATDGGFRLSGSFNMGSGSAAASWVMVAAPLEARDGQPWFRGHIIPKQDVDITAGSWDVMGLRATTSIDYTITDKFVPAHRTYEYPFVQPRTAGAVSFQYLALLNQVGLTAFASGVGQRALAELIEAAPKTKRLAGEGTQADDNVVQFGIGELEGRMRAARTHFVSLVAKQDRHIAEHGYPDAVISADAAQAAHTLTRAARDMVVFAFDYAGSTVIFASHPLQRCLRDIFTGLKHAAFTPAVLTRIGKDRLGASGGPISVR
jgi:alkylation response protein AidB-like acyl-CoA dehydrogenase